MPRLVTIARADPTATGLDKSGLMDQISPETGEFTMWRVGISETVEISHEDLTEPQGLLPSQFFPRNGRAARVEGERKLMVAVLEDAVRCFRKYSVASNRRGRRLFREVEAWFMEPDTGSALSFEYVCEASGLDADSIRSRLRRWHHEKIAVERLRDPMQRSVRLDPSATDGAVRLKMASGE